MIASSLLVYVWHYVVARSFFDAIEGRSVGAVVLLVLVVGGVLVLLTRRFRGSGLWR